MYVDGRYEVRDYAAGSSGKKFHVWDHETKREVFHTDKRERAEALVGLAGNAAITQHLKDRGHFAEYEQRGVCKVCKRP